MVRKILTWRILGEDLVGTCHVPTPRHAGELAGASAVGVLLLNAGPTMRSGNSDLSIHISERLARRGFPVFRFDLPGLGDSSGPTPTNLDEYWSEVVDGRNDAATVALIARIQLECGLARVVVGGLCAAVVPCVRALDSGSSAPAGLILLEPNFRQAPRIAEAPPARIDTNGANATVLSRIRLRTRWLRDGRLARATRPLHASLRNHFGSALSSDANVALIRTWQASFARKTPSLVVVAEGHSNDLYVTRLLECMPDRAVGAVACVRVSGAHHLLNGEVCRERVLGAAESWMTQCFGNTRDASEQRVETARR